MDKYETTGNTASPAATMISSAAATYIELQLPPISTVEHYYYFRLFATAHGGYTKYSDNIKIRFVNCAYTVLSAPTPYTTPVTYHVKDVDDTATISWSFTPTTSDFVECRDI